MPDKKTLEKISCSVHNSLAVSELIVKKTGKKLISITFVGSGSKGNSSLLDFDGKRFLLDAGFSCRRITNFLKDQELSPEDLSGIFVTHEHEDHTKGLKVLLKKHDLPIYTTYGTYAALLKKGVPAKKLIPVSAAKEIEISGVRCFPFNVPHDAVDPLGFRFEYSGQIATVATDLGHITSEVRENVSDAELLCLESNYDDEMLQNCSYPYWLKKRIRSALGHLPNTGVRGILTRMKKPPKVLALMHLSQESNTPELVQENLETLAANSISALDKTKVFIISQDHASPCLNLGKTLPLNLKKSLLSQGSLDFAQLAEVNA